MHATHHRTIDTHTEDAHEVRRMNESAMAIDFAAAAQSAVTAARVAAAIHLAQIGEAQHQHAIERGERS